MEEDKEIDSIQIIDKKHLSAFSLSVEHLDHLVGAIEDFKKMNYKLPSEIIMNKEFGQYYFDQYMQGVAIRVLYKNKPIWITVNNRFRASEMFMK